MDSAGCDLVGAVESALAAYGISATSVTPVERESTYAQVFCVMAGGSSYLVRLRDKRATVAEVIFASHFARTVGAEVPVPVGLLPSGEIPRIAGRPMEVQPFITHEHSDGGRVGPGAWLKIGYWLGCLHRLGQPLMAQAPVDLPYGNYPGRLLSELQSPADVLDLPPRCRDAWAEARELLRKPRKVIADHHGLLERGVVHGDMHFWNVLYSGQQPVAIVDLDFLQQGYLIADLAYASIWLNAWDRDRKGDWVGIMARYLESYESGRQRSLTQAERDCLPWMRVVLDLFFFQQNVLAHPDIEEKWRGDLNSARETAANVRT